MKRRKSNVVFHMSGVDVTLAHMPKYNGFMCRGGVHGDTKYNRRKEDRDFRRILREDY